ncbi:reverse transcriptase domain-containing protein [Tanacetum coccineum]
MRWQIMRQIEIVEMETIMEMEATTQEAVVEGRHTLLVTIGNDAAYRMPWKTLMKMMTKNYFPRSEIKKLETEFWNLSMKGTDVESYTQCFQELILLCSRMIPDEDDKVERKTFGIRVTETYLKFVDFNTLSLQERRTVEHASMRLRHTVKQRASNGREYRAGLGFRSYTSRSHYWNVSKQTTRYE